MTGTTGKGDIFMMSADMTEKLRWMSVNTERMIAGRAAKKMVTVSTNERRMASSLIDVKDRFLSLFKAGIYMFYESTREVSILRMCVL